MLRLRLVTGRSGWPLQRVDVQCDSNSKGWSQLLERLGKERCRLREWHMHRPQRRGKPEMLLQGLKAGCGTGRREGLGCAGPGRQWWGLHFMLSATKGEQWDDTRVLKSLWGSLESSMWDGGQSKTFKSTSEQKRLHCVPSPNTKNTI